VKWLSWQHWWWQPTAACSLRLVQVQRRGGFWTRGFRIDLYFIISGTLHDRLSVVVVVVFAFI